MLSSVLKIQGVHFCSGKNFAGSFKIRSRLTEFFKHVHPDQLHQAPTKIKQENLRSLKNFNSYIDSLNQQRSIEAKLLKFYIAEKTNTKSKKFYSFTIELPQLKSQSLTNQQQTESLIQNIVSSLNKKFEESRNIGSGKKKTTLKTEHKEQSVKQQRQQSQQEKINRMQETIQPFRKVHKYKNELMEDQLQSTITSKYMQAEKDTLMTQLRKRVSFADSSSNKSMMWSRIALDQSGIYNDYQDILANLIDPKLIYFNEKLTDKQIQQFKKRLLPGNIGSQEHKQSKVITQICSQMESLDPPMNFYVTTHYSGSDIPGFFSVFQFVTQVPFSFRTKQLEHYFSIYKQKIIEERQKFEQFYDYHKQLLQQLKQRHNITVQLGEFTGNQDIWQKILMLKRLQKYKFDMLTIIVAFDGQEFDVLLNQYQLQKGKTVIQFKTKLFLTINFLDEDMDDLMQKVNQQALN